MVIIRYTLNGIARQQPVPGVNASEGDRLVLRVTTEPEDGSCLIEEVTFQVTSVIYETVELASVNGTKAHSQLERKLVATLEQVSKRVV